MPETDHLEQRIRATLAALDRAGLRRSLQPPCGVDLSSNDYLGLASHPLIERRMAEAVTREGVGSTGSRLLRGERECFRAVEQRFAHFKRAGGALYFSSGYLANIAVLSALPQSGDVIFSDEYVHASLIDGARLSKARRVIFRHNDLAALARALREEPCEGQRFIVTESLFSMEGDFAPLPECAALCREHGAALIVDEAHAVGIYGERGSGWIEACRAEGDVLISINTAGKALGVAGAFVAGPEWAIEFLMQRARPFIFSTAPPPAVAAALEASLDVLAAEPERRAVLLSRSARLRKSLGIPGDSQIVPVILGQNDRATAVAAELQALGFDVRAIRPPTVPEGTARLRISVHANLSDADLDRFAASFHAATACAASS